MNYNEARAKLDNYEVVTVNGNTYERKGYNIIINNNNTVSGILGCEYLKEEFLSGTKTEIHTDGVFFIGEIERETEKAILINGFWLPKSQTKVYQISIDKVAVDLPEWLYTKVKFNMDYTHSVTYHGNFFKKSVEVYVK